MKDFKNKFLLMKKKLKEERNKNGDEYMPYKKYYEDENNEEENEVILLNKKRLENSEAQNDSKKEIKNNFNKDLNFEKEEIKKKKIDINNKENKKEFEKEKKLINNENKIIDLKEENIKENNKIDIKEDNKNDNKEENKEENKTDIKRKSKYKITIKPSYITIEKKDNAKKRVVDPTQFSNEYKSEELFNWINLVLEDWEQYIMENLNNKRVKSNIISKELEKYKQCCQNVKPLLSLLQERELNQVILDKLFKVMVFAENRDLLNANDRYIDLSIGNAAWPMGLTMVGIHQRTGKSSIAPTQVAYILNDEVTKKYLQSIRRILSFLQIRYNISPSQSVYN